MGFDFQKRIENNSDEQLLHIYSNFDQYQDEYIDIVSKELDRRGVDFTNLKLRRRHKEEFMLAQLEKGKPGNPVYVTMGFVSALFGGILGIIAGYVYSQSKNKEWGDGTHYYYNLKTRNLGTGMMLLGIVVLIISLVYKFT